MSKEWIPNINIGQDYDSSYKDAPVHFDKLGKLADFFGRDMPMHLHGEFCQIHFVLSGKTLFNIDQNTFGSEGAALFYTPPATPHAFWTEPEAPGYVITIHSSLLQKFTSQLDSYSSYNMLLMPLMLEARYLNESDWLPIAKLFELLKLEWESAANFNHEAIEALLQLLLIHLLRLSGTQLPRFQHNQAEVMSFRQFSQLVEQHFTEQKKITFYCDKLNINENRLNYICKKISHASPKKIINGRIILEAKRLLSHTNMNLTEITYTLGYNDPSYFSRLFLRHTNSTPSDFRAIHRSQ